MRAPWHLPQWGGGGFSPFVTVPGQSARRSNDVYGVQQNQTNSDINYDVVVVVVIRHVVGRRL